ncbi:MAG: alkaline phosphatase [Bacteroidales bacterium]|nr:alkaline phosphatase [Bacteroidales bacterium]
MILQRFFAAILTIALAFNSASFTSEAKKKDEKAKYIFLFIGDGMGATHVATAESYLSHLQGKLGGEMLTMSQFPYYGTATTYSANKGITDSSAAGTAISCGVKTYNGGLGVDAEGNAARSITYDLKEDGYKIGVMSTVAINHATPGAFYASSNSRNDYYDISTQIVKTGFEFFAGSGFIDFRGKRGEDKEAIDVYLEKNGYEVTYGIDEFKRDAQGKDKVIFCQESNRAESAGNYVSSGDIPADATLGEMLELGIEYLGEKEPFFIMCEGGDIDWTAHANKTMPMVMDVLEFDEAIAIAYEFYKKHPKETLIVVTADHETGGLSLGAGPELIGWDMLIEQWEKDSKQNNLDRKANSDLNRKASIGWTTGGHTGTPVPVFSIGKGAEKFSGRMDNTEFKSKILGE